MKKTRSKNSATAESIARMADKGKDVSRFFTNAGRMMTPVQRVNVDFTASMLGDPLYLPPYSPDLNPLEKAWAKLKQLLRARRYGPKQRSPRSSHHRTAAPDHERECRGMVQAPPRHSTAIRKTL
jgi:transposase